MNIDSYVRNVSLQLNRKYHGIISNVQTDSFIKELSTLNCSDDEIVSLVEDATDRAIDSYARYIIFDEPLTEERKFELNDLFSCSITNDTLHIHVIPVSVKEDIVRMGGPRRYFAFTEEKLSDAFDGIIDILGLEENANVTEVYAVSKLLKMRQIQAAFKENGFDVGLTGNEFLQERFGANELYEAVISREKFLSLHSKRNEGENMRDDNMENEIMEISAELNQMLLDGENSNKSVEKSEWLGEKSDAKVLVKTTNEVAGNDTASSSVSNSSEGGYGSVFGVVLVIVSVSFLLAGLFIRMLS